ncbi:MAG TPA: hypothetical protein VNR60_01785 [Croceibacterium sp.]|nr:hypothetical protein [Croceibacterium sp.]
MIRITRALRRFLKLVLDTGEVAVAIHYSAPWYTSGAVNPARFRPRANV